MKIRQAKEKAIEIFWSAIDAVNPYNSIKNQSKKILSFYRERGIKMLFVIGFGKASYEMARGINDSLNEIITEGIIITKYQHSKGVKTIDKIKVFEAGHPIPDDNGVEATKRVVGLLKKADERTLAVTLISGGGSALLVSPMEPITLKEKQEATKLLLEAGADINEVNTVRKHISSVKGGRLAQIAYPAYIKSFILSDVLKDRLDVIASGPTTFDPTTYPNALDAIERYGLLNKMPQSIIGVLNKGIKGEVPETPKENNFIFKNIENTIIGSNKIALANAKSRAQELGFYTDILSTELEGEAKEVGRWLARVAMAYKDRKDASNIKKPVCLLSGGETTVKVTGTGKGGRNTELALAFAIEIRGKKGILLLSAGTDGTDGPTDAAGAYVTGETVPNANNIGISPFEYLDNNDSYNFFKKLDSLFITGPTGTNVMDIQITLIE